MALFFLVLTLMGCNASKTTISETLDPPTEAETKYEEPTPDDLMTLALNQVDEEMRIFDVEAHHDVLFDKISSLDKTLSEDALKSAISVIVKDYMDAYFRVRVGEILSEFNENYTESDVETLFNGTSRTSLYAFIELYEWSFYNNHR